METKRVVVYMPQVTHQELKSKLALERVSISEWFRREATAYLDSEPREKNSKNFSESFQPLCSLAMCRKPAIKKNKLGEWRCEEHL